MDPFSRSPALEIDIFNRRLQQFILMTFEAAYANIGCSGAKIASTLIIKNKVVGMGLNSNKSDPLQSRYGRNSLAIYKHAEISCIKNSLRNINKEDFRDAILIVMRSKKNGDWGYCCPCKGCQQAINDFGINKVIYSGTEKGKVHFYH